MSIVKLLPLLFVASFISSCGKGSKNITPIIEFTQRLNTETNHFAPSIPQENKVFDWSGINFINEIAGNFAISNPQFVFQNSNIRLSSNISAAPVIKNQLLFLLDAKNNVICYDLATHKQMWKTNLDINKDFSNVRIGGVSVDETRVYVVNGSRDLIVLELSTGYEVSRLKLNDLAFRPVVVDEKRLYVATANNQLISLDKTTLSTLWQVGGTQSSLVLSMQNFNSPIIIKDSLLVDFNTGELAFVNTKTSQPAWSMVLSQNSEDPNDMSYANLCSQPILDGVTAYLANCSGALDKIDVAHGEVIWNKKIQDILSMNKFGDLLVLTTNAQEIAGLSAKTGEIAWVIDLTKQEKGYNKPYNLLTPIMVNNLVYVFSSHGKLYEITPEGKLLNTYTTPKQVKFYAVNNDTIYLFAGSRVFINKN
jgi:outer membrane protein assembly factor BamB